MNKLITIIACLIASFYNVQAQFAKDRVFESKGEGLGFYVEGEKFFLEYVGRLGSPGGTYTLFLDTIPIKTSIPFFGVVSYHYDPIKNSFFAITPGPNARLISINFDTNTYYEQTFENHSSEVLYYGKVYFTKIETGEIVSYDYVNNEIKTNFIQDILSLDKHFRPLFILKLNEEEMMICSGYFGDGVYYNVEYHIFNEVNKQITKITPSGNLAEVLLENVGILLFYDIQKRSAFFVNGILDSNYDFFSGFLDITTLSITDFVIKDGEIIQLLVSSPLDEPVSRWNSNRQRVRIPYVPCPHRERVMFMIYHNELLSYDDLVRFDAHDLRLMRNMVFAKYNNDFSATFLKAYFNLYDFYRNGRNNRIRDVSHLLTEADKANLALIRAAEARVKE
ncbi:MAG: YARHG domain-containing protein [Tenuifilaceae bacterium]|jgi:hypothetical protein|nr:YARHG domain-containing protein [Tenuifilaceae bacterium]